MSKSRRTIRNSKKGLASLLILRNYPIKSFAFSRPAYTINLSGFGVGPTSPASNVGIPTDLYAGVPVLASPTTIAHTTAPAVAEETNVWYGSCVDTTITADSYTDTVLYTAIVNL